MSQTCKAIILDFDGTIIESVGIKDWAFKTLYQDYPEHLDAIMEYHLAHNATLRFEKFRYIATEILDLPYGDKEEADLSECFHQLVFNRIVKSPFVTGAMDFLEYFKSKMPLYLISKSPNGELEEILQAKSVRSYFKSVYAGSWQKDKAIADILKREKIKPLEAVYIGDAPEDQSVAHVTGVPFIGRNSGKAFAEPNDPVFDDLTGVRKHLSSGN